MATTSSHSGAAQQQAQQAIDDFERSLAPGVWPGLSKPTLVAEIRSRVRDPFLLNQGGQPFCGPASVLFELIRKQPLRYVEICRSLFERGVFQAKSRLIEASERLRQSQGRLRMGQADWLVLATLRESENLIFPVEPDAPDIIRNLGGMTKSWEMKGWVREVLGYTHVKYEHTYIYGEFAAMREAEAAMAEGGVAFALITAEGLLSDKPPLLAVPNHWVTLLGNLSIQPGKFLQHDSGHVSFDVYSWAQRLHVDIDEGPFEDYFWGVVIGR
ncbi:hypothetical protein [Leptolyngbya sp. FACHB-261]|uniref:hypothetical protein n=1 Tax=Leptolyngbya sp. FACHB-261 TaxID=2692806 RepID=UPI0016891480|nr:hypothetical protein [Leptolyngbya sp. FACHB-261]MBD2100819.1 hypothetical protein [Leptolyngbya sp. FACHB-261]